MSTNSITCVRGGPFLPPLSELAEKYQLERPRRIQCRKPNLREKNPQLEEILSSERKIERVLRSKSTLDNLFELVPMSPWRQTGKLRHHTDGKKILHLDFKNFYPSILCATLFPHPAKLQIRKETSIPEEPAGILRCRLHLKKEGHAQEIHPFQLQTNQKSAPFRLERDRPVETLLHLAELPIWKDWFEIEPVESITSPVAIPHPLTYRVHAALGRLEEIRNTGGDPAEETTLKLRINAATTTPKIQRDRQQSSPYGVHCLPSQIVSLGRALLFHTIHTCLEIEPEAEILLINTDGFQIASRNPHRLKTALKTAGILGENPGQLREKSQADEGLFLGPNIWWTLENGALKSSIGTGANPQNHPVPLLYSYSAHGKTHKVQYIHLADFRHHLDHETLQRRKFKAPENPGHSTIRELLETEKKRSFQKTLHELRSLRKNLTTALP